MTTLSKTVDATPQQVWEILADGWLYPLWVVGASRMRDVDDNWPEVGAQLHHSVGTWPVLIDDTTEVTECRPMRGLKLRARAWPTGEAAVEIELEPEGSGTKITMSEDAVSGPALLTPKPIRDIGLLWRNKETLQRLAYLCERRP